MDQEQDETIVVSRTTPMVEEETIVTSSNPGVTEETVTNPTFTKNEVTTTGPQGFGVIEESEPVGLIPTYQPEVIDEDTDSDEITIEREVGQVFEAPTVVPTKAIPLPVVDTSKKFEVAPDEVKKSKPSSDASKLFKKNMKRSKRNSLTVILVVVAGALLIGVTLALLLAALT